MCSIVKLYRATFQRNNGDINTVFQNNLKYSTHFLEYIAKRQIFKTQHHSKIILRHNLK